MLFTIFSVFIWVNMAFIAYMYKNLIITEVEKILMVNASISRNKLNFKNKIIGYFSYYEVISTVSILILLVVAAIFKANPLLMVLNLLSILISLLLNGFKINKNPETVSRKRILIFSKLFFKKSILSVNELKLDFYSLYNHAPKHLKRVPIGLADKPSYETTSIYTAFMEIYGSIMIKPSEGLLLEDNPFAENPIINSILLDNITFLRTIVTILNDEKLYNSLQTDLGSCKQEELVNKLLKIKKDIDYAKETIVKKDEILESLSIIDSMTAFSNRIK